MSHTIELPDRTYALLQECMVPLLDDHAVVVERGLRCLARSRTVISPPYPNTLERGDHRFDAESPPSLKFSEIIDAQLGDRHAHSWNELHREAYVLALSGPEAMCLEELQELTSANVVRGEFRDRGFRYLGKVDFSIQGVNSNVAWRNVLRITQRIELPLAVRFRWEFTRRARYPGVVGSMAFLPPVA